MLSLYVKDNVFILTSMRDNGVIPSGYQKVDFFSHLYGYAFHEGRLFKNENLTEECNFSISKNLVQSSGIFCALHFSDGKARLALDPLCQFNIFYRVDSDFIYLSNSIDCLKFFSGADKVNENYVYDQLAYQSLLRSETILDGVYYLKFDDIVGKELVTESWEFVKSNPWLSVVKPEYSFYDELSYDDLLGIYIERLNSRASILSELYDEVHVQLTGGADSRLATSSFAPFPNSFYYVYGDGSSQNRLIFEHIVDALGLRRSSPVLFVGQPLTNSSRLFRGLSKTNYCKLNNLNTYMNGPVRTDKKVCKITGYYGANVSGGVVLPPDHTPSNPRLSVIPEDLFTYHDYIDRFKAVNSGLRRAEFNDLFYINNRGKSHYSAHSLADNLSVDSFDILYDFINLIMVRLCPYTDEDIDRNAISVDLIFKNNPQLALFPYDDRRIPKYKRFDNVPLINCFDGYKFCSRDISPLDVYKPIVDDDEFAIAAFGDRALSLQQCREHEVVRRIAYKYPNLEFLIERNDAQAGIFLQFVLSCLYLGVQ